MLVDKLRLHQLLMSPKIVSSQNISDWKKTELDNKPQAQANKVQSHFPSKILQKYLTYITKKLET